MPSSPATGDRPNVLIFCVDEMRADHLAGAGNPVVQTPNLDRLAARGTRFANAWCNNPICMPARATMFTGLLPRDHGLRVNGQALRTDLPVLPEILRRAGWRTHAAGKLHLTPWVPKVEPPEPHRYPECLDYWQRGLIERFPTPYYGFTTVDYVGGHVSYAYGDYLRWLVERGGDPRLLGLAAAIEPVGPSDKAWKLAMPQELHYNRFIADSTIALIQESARAGAPPFFAWCSFPDPHTPVAPPRPWCDMYQPSDVALPARREGELDDLPGVYRDVITGRIRANGVDNRDVSDDEWRRIIAGTYGMISHLDAELGRVMAALDESGLADRTIIIFTGDHGDMMGDHGLLWKAFYTFCGCTNIPQIVVAPGHAAGQVATGLTAQIDLLPSVLDLCGVPLPDSDWQARETPFERGSCQPLRPYPGVSWASLLDPGAPPVRNRVVIENDEPCTGFRVRALVTPRHRVAVYPGTPDGELFDLEADPDELHNLWYRPEAATLKATLLAELLAAYSLETPLAPVPPWNA